MAMPPSPAESTAGAEAQGSGRLRQVLALTEQAEALLSAGRFDEAARTARDAALLELNLERTWRVLAQACDALGDFAGAFAAYRQAVAVATDLGDMGPGMGRAALRVGEYAIAESVLTMHLRQSPAAPDAIADLAQAQAALEAFDRAHATLKAALENDPGQARLWAALGELLCAQGRHGEAVVFFEEALRLDPGSVATRAGLADALLVGAGDVDRAVALSEEAMATAAPSDMPAMTASHARRLLAAGRLAEGWTAYARGMEPGDAGLVEHRVAAPRWTPGDPLNGRLLLLGEEFIGDELLLAQMVPSLLAEGLPLILAVSPRWTSLAQRSFPQAKVAPLRTRSERGLRQHAADLDSPHVHGGDLVAAWNPLRAMTRARRSRPTDFAGAQPYLKADSRRVRHWREQLANLGPGPKIGLRWRQLVDVANTTEVPSLDDLRDPLSVPGLRLISLQENDLMGEAASIRDRHGLELLEPPGINHEDLDDVAALSCALDVVVGPPGATTYLAAACGAETWFLSPPRHWAMLGTDGYPWFPKARVISASSADWSAAMDELGRALLALAQGSARPAAG